MIELDLISYLKSDATLDGLLGSTGSDSKIYPSQVPHGAEVPYIILNTQAIGTFDENLKEVSFAFNCVSDSIATAKSIRDRLITLLDKQDGIQGDITSATYRLYYSKNVGGDNFVDPELGYYHHVVIFDFKFQKVA